MDLDRFAPLIFFFIVFFSILRKRLAKKKKAGARSRNTTGTAGPSAAKPGKNQWLGKLVEALHQVKAEIEAAQKRGAGEKEDPWEKLRPPKPAQPGLVRDKNAAAVDQPTPAPVKKRQMIEAPEPVRSKPAVEPDRSQPRARKTPFKRISLKQAVVWSEILGPPVSLRDDA